MQSYHQIKVLVAKTSSREAEFNAIKAVLFLVLLAATVTMTACPGLLAPHFPACLVGLVGLAGLAGTVGRS